MTWEPRPIPDVTPESKRYWEAASEGTLLLSACDLCGLKIHFPRAICPECLGDTSWVESEGTGTVYSYTVLEDMANWPEDELPVILAHVELTEGVTMMTNIISSTSSEISVGTEVAVTFIPTNEDGIAIPVFEPI